MRLRALSSLRPSLSSAVLAGCLLLFASPGFDLVAQEVVEPPAVVLAGLDFDISAAAGAAGSPWTLHDAEGTLVASGLAAPFEAFTIEDVSVRSAQAPLVLEIAGESLEVAPLVLPGWFSLLPPLVAIVMALVFREVVTALFAGVWLGTTALSGFNPVAGLWRSVDAYIMPAVADPDHASIIIFSLLLGGMVGLIARNGGTNGIVQAVAPVATSKRRGALATWFAGMAIFFDDYANTLVVGNTMRPITDRLKISREKLAYLVDSTAAPVAALVPISTWVGYEISLISDGLATAAAQNASDPALVAQLTQASPFAVFLHSIPYLFYPLLALAFVVLTSAMKRDFGPMAAAEERAVRGGGLFRPGAQLATDTESAAMTPKEGAPARWWNAALPVLTVVAVVLGGLYIDGRSSAGAEAGLMDIFSEANPFTALLWGSLGGCVVAFILSTIQRILTLQEAIDAWMGGLRAMMIAMVVLTLAWSLGAVTETLQTAPFLTQLVEGNIPLRTLPAIVFVTSAAIAFATGTSWGTMAIMIPLVVPLTVGLGGAIGFEEGAGYSVLLGAISSVLAGAIFGDHCSPISDTTVLSSTAAGCDHVDHVRTQLPYALVVAAIALLIGDLGTAYGLPNGIALLGGVALLVLVLRVAGSPTEDAPGPADASI
ncbi:MAG: Na+/H+ antiporter NhaC family protein [Longimicrobiales bacterium]|nr:Na+/H+ antiporter NhaC family protein [Longimicrobiales bacterium]